MRVNIYGEEYNDHRVELVTKVVDDEHTFYGIRLYLKFPNQEWWIHRKVDGQPDDDSSAITIWGASKMQIRDLLAALYNGLEEPTALTTPGAVPVGDGFEEVPWGDIPPNSTFGYGNGPAGEYGMHPIFDRETTSMVAKDGDVTVEGPDAQIVADILNDGGIPAKVVSKR